MRSWTGFKGLTVYGYSLRTRAGEGVGDILAFLLFFLGDVKETQGMGTLVTFDSYWNERSLKPLKSFRTFKSFERMRGFGNDSREHRAKSKEEVQGSENSVAKSEE